MFEKFKSYIRKEKLFEPTDKILLTVSGGMDSVVMLELFHQAGFEFGIAHVNFKLRGDESDGDQLFVEGLAKKYNALLHINSFDTKEYAKKYKLSTQMAARELRYQFFEEIRKEFDYQYIATAHHTDDQVETLFINLLRGTGIAGLRGILPKQNGLIRPLLFAKREEIVNFRVEHNLPYREDSSNASDNYLRNKIRHQLMPALEGLDANYLDLLNANMKRFGESEQIYKQHINLVRSELQFQKSGRIYISVEKLKKYSPLVTYLFELLKPFGFLFSQAEDIVQSLDHESGKHFFSETHELLKDREYLIIRDKQLAQANNTLEIDESTESIDFPICLKFKKLSLLDYFVMPTHHNIGALDYAKLKFPLTIRKWEEGDVFCPLGSKFKKKLSNFFIDRKFNLFEKEDAYLLCSGEDIVWIIGHQLDDRFKITDKTKDVFWVEFQ